MIMGNLALASLTIFKFLWIGHCLAEPAAFLPSQRSHFMRPSKPQIQPDRLPIIDADFDNRIIGGEDAKPHEFESIISLQFQFYANEPSIFNHTCTGSIVNKHWVLTAGHCSVIGPKGSYRVLAGSNNQYSFTGSEQFRSVIDIQTHPLYNSYHVDYDIAMLLVDTPFEFNKYVKPAKLAPRNYTAIGTAITAGWGLTNENATVIPAKLQKITLPIVDRETCKNIYQTRNPVTIRMLCAGGQQDRNVCHGDSGGPLYSSDENGLILSGLTSWGLGCAEAGFPGVFTDVSYFHDWIHCVSKNDASLGLCDADCVVENNMSHHQIDQIS